MFKLPAFLLSITLLTSCQYSNTPAMAKNEDADFSTIHELPNYYSYLNKLIELQETYESDQKKTLVFPIKFHSIGPLLNTPLTEQTYIKTIDYLNRAFKSTNIQFILEPGVDYIFSSTSLDTFYRNGKLENLFTAKTYLPNAINIYVVSQSDKVLGFTHYPQFSSQRLFISSEKTLDPAIIHEMGHFFGLLHTFEGKQIIALDDNSFTANFEGDKIADTPADTPNASFIQENCTLYGEYFDQFGIAYKPDLSNYMSYYDLCRKSFSAEQQRRMYFIARKIKLPQIMVKA